MPYPYAGDHYCRGRGDYYRGDYYRGDPFLGGLFKKIGGVVGGVARGVLGATPLGAVAKTALSVGSSLLGRGERPGSPFAMTLAPPPSNLPVPASYPGAHPVPGIGGAVSRFLPFGESGYQVCAPGYHISKRTGACVRNRRMNVTNPRALRRALRRAQGFSKLARRFITVTSRFKSGKKKKKK
jgi:hypothetical protein